MGYEDKSESTGSPRPHADHIQNISSSDEFMKREDVKRFMKVNNISTYTEKVGPNSYGLVGSNLSAVCFSWHRGKSKFACPISFHQDNGDFLMDLHRFFGLKGISFSLDKKTPSTYSAFKDS